MASTLVFNRAKSGGTAWQAAGREISIGTPLPQLALAAGLCLVPVSIAASETLLSIALAMQLVRVVRGRQRLIFPRSSRLWLLWTVSALIVWISSPELRSGWSEVRHMLLVGSVLLVLPALDTNASRKRVWKGIFLTSTGGALVMIGEFFFRLVKYRLEVSAGGDAGFYLRSGGFLHHWMVYASVEILVFAGLLSFWSIYPEERRRWWPVLGIHGVAVLLSLTRMAWVTCFALVAIELLWRRSKWLWALPALPVVLYLVSPGAVRMRVSDSIRPTYYSNSERLQMLRVGWDMVRTHPFSGIGPGRVEAEYTNYLKPGEAVPKYHGHLHNNIVQIAAQYGIPVTLASVLFVAILLRDLLKVRGKAATRQDRFVGQAGVLALVGFLIGGLFEYTYGHSLALIMVSFAVFSPLLPASARIPAKT
jgi:O-antigen ligase